MITDLHQHVVTVDAGGHHDVTNNKVGQELKSNLETFFAARSHTSFVTFQSQDFLDVFKNCAFVFNDQYLRHVICWASTNDNVPATSNVQFNNTTFNCEKRNTTLLFQNLS